jgi:multidrug resistance efflux pump
MTTPAPSSSAPPSGASRSGAPAAGPFAAHPGPALVQDEALAALRQLLRVEAEMRRAADGEALAILAVNELRKIARARQVFYADVSSSGAIRLSRASGLPTLERDAPLVRWTERAAAEHLPPALVHNRATVRLNAGDGALGEGRNHPFPHALWLPLRGRDEKAFAGVLALREIEWPDGDVALAERLVETAAHAARALAAGDRSPRPRGRAWLRRGGIAALALALAAMAIPVPMTALAPAEIVGRDAFVVAAPLEGVIERVVVAPNSAVAEGDLLVQFVDTTQRNQLEVSEREVGVAEAKLKQISQAAFFDDKSRREIAQARAELKLRSAERDFAREQFEKTRLRAPRAGVAVYADPKEWAGKPVQTGQRILEIANAQEVEMRVDVAVADVVALKLGARARLFLDADPLRPVEGRVVNAAYAARPIEGHGLVYRVQARLEEGLSPPRLGARGVAQLHGDDVMLGFYLFRRPISWLRQKVGL